MSSLSAKLSLDAFERKLASYRPSTLTGPGLQHAAVAAVLRFDRGAPDVLLMQRAIREGDKWSGQISMPGGRASELDMDLRATAVRETLEEVGLDLATTARPLGRLDTIHAVARGRITPMTITPFVFVQTADAPIQLGDEAVHAFWLPLDRAAMGELRAEYPYALGPVSMTLPCWKYDGHTVWGLTYKMLERLLEVVAPGLHPPRSPR